MKSILLVFFLLLCATLHGLEDEVEPGPLPAGATAYSGPGKLNALSLSPDGKLIATGGSEGIVRFWDGKTARMVKQNNAHDAACVDVAFAVDGKSVFTCGGDRTLRQFDLDGKELRRFEGHNGEVSRVRVSPDGLRIASTDSAGVRIWDVRTGAQLQLLSGHKVPGDPRNATALSIEGLAYSADGRMIFSEANDETARLWDTRSAQTLRVLPQHDGSVAAIGLSPDGRWAISTRGGGRLRIWELASGKVSRVLTGHELDITCVAFSPDGRYILAGAGDEVLRQWVTESGLELRRFKLTSPPQSVAFARDGRTAVSISPAEGVVIWDMLAPLKPTLNVAPAGPDKAWEMLGAPNYDPRNAAAQFFLAIPPAEALAEIERRLNSAVTKEEEAQKLLIDQLDHSNFAIRARAFDDLKSSGNAARIALRSARAHVSEEVRMRVSELLGEIGGPDDFRIPMLMEVLRLMNTPQSRTLLDRIVSQNASASGTAAQALEK